MRIKDLIEAHLSHSVKLTIECRKVYQYVSMTVFTNQFPSQCLPGFYSSPPQGSLFAGSKWLLFS